MISPHNSELKMMSEADSGDLSPSLVEGEVDFLFYLWLCMKHKPGEPSHTTG